MINDFIKGMFSYFDAFAFIRKQGLSRYYWYCGIIGLITMSFLASIVTLFSSDISDYFLSLINVDIGWVSKISNFLVHAIITIFFFIIFKYLMLILTSPLMSKLSENVESILEDDYISIPFSVRQILSDFGRAIRLSLRNITRELGYTALLIIIGLFPIFAIASTPFIFLVQAYFAGFGNMDFFLERHLDSNDTIHFVKENKGIAAGNGTMYVLLLAIPIVGVFLAPALGATAAALQVHKKME